MAEVIAFEDLRKIADSCKVLPLFGGKRPTKANGSREKFDFPSSRPFISGNLTDLFEQSSAVAMRHHHGDPKVPAIVAQKCVELIQALEQYAEPE